MRLKVSHCSIYHDIKVSTFIVLLCLSNNLPSNFFGYETTLANNMSRDTGIVQENPSIDNDIILNQVVQLLLTLDRKELAASLEQSFQAIEKVS